MVLSEPQAGVVAIPMVPRVHKWLVDPAGTARCLDEIDALRRLPARNADRRLRPTATPGWAATGLTLCGQGTQADPEQDAERQAPTDLPGAVPG